MFSEKWYKSLLKYLLLFALFGMLYPAGTASAQPSLNFKRIVNNWPTIELYFSVGCNGTPAYNFNKEQNFKVYENGIEVGEFTLWCPDPRVRCAISVSLVFDASGSMYGAGNAGAIAAGNAFVDLMDGLVDEACIVFFESSVNVRLGMTTNLTDLHDAVNSLPVLGATACWDGIYVGVSELINSGNNPCRAVIAMTDGGDNSSTHTPQDVIALANRNRIRVFTIGLGGVEPTNLELIALLTGGKYYQAPSADQLVAIYQEISTIIFAGFMECLITYQAKCMDGGLRTVDLSLLQFCNGSDTKTKTYRAPKDTSTYLPLEIALGKRKGRGSSEVRVPLDLVTPIDPLDNFERSTFVVEFDPSCVQLKGIETPPGTLLNGIPITVDYLANGVQFKTTERKQIQGNGTLAELVFQLSDPDDTTCCELKLTNWVFEAGCFRPVLKNGEICIEPRAPIVICNIQMPTELVWVRSAKDYSPNPFQVMCRVFNQGDKDAKKVMFKIDFDPTDIQLISPFSDLQPGTPIDVPVADVSEAAWMVKAKSRLTGDSVQICITAMFENHKNVTCCAKVWIPPTEPILDCTVSAPTIVADNDNQKYVPMPFQVTVNVTNKGGMKSDTVWARITVPSKLALAGADAPNNHTKKLMPVVLLPNQTGSVSWTLSHPISLVELEYVVQVWVRTSNADSTLCETKVTIPPLMAPSLQATCVTPYQLVFDENLGEYTPNPFNVQLQVINASPMLANNVTGYMWMPGNVVLDPTSPTSTLRYDFGTLTQFRTGDPVPTATWTVRYTKKLRVNTVLEFKWSVAGVGPTGIPTDTVNAFCTVDVPGLKPSFECTTVAPDSLALNAAETNVEPNPFTYTYTIRNTSKQIAAIQYIEVYYSPGDGIDLDVTSPNPKRATINKTLEPGKDTSISWIFKATNRITRRTVQLQAVAVDDEGNPITCTDQFPIAALKTALTCNLTTTETPIEYDQILRDYKNPNWVIEAELMNAGGFAISNIIAELKIVTDPFGLVEFDPGYTDANPYTFPIMFIGERLNPKWHMRLAKPNMTGVSQYVEFSVTYSSNETPQIVDACNVLVEIQPVLTPKLVCSLNAPVDSIRFDTDHYTPNPFDVQLRIENVGNGDARNVNAYVLQDPAFTTATGTPSYRQFGSLPSGNVIGFGDNEGFRMTVTPRGVDGWDTVRVVVVADGIPEALCEVPIWVQAEKRPVFQMDCQAQVSTLTFNEQLNDYVPNPFEVTTKVVNIGEALARNCKLVFVGPKKFTPYGQNSIQPVTLNGGTLNPFADTATFTWQMRALRQDVASMEEMVFQIVGTGGLGDDIVIGECRVPIQVPPARAASYTMTCSAPAALTFDNTTGNYIPDPFTFTAVIRNTGAAEGQNIEVLPALTGNVTLAPLDTIRRFIPSLAVGAEVTLTWQVNAIATLQGDTALLCATLTDRFNASASCCEKTYIPAATELNLSLLCQSQFSALTVNTQTGDYTVNPFEVTLNVTNNGTRPADSVRLENIVFIDDNGDLSIANGLTPPALLALRLDPNQGLAQPLSWLIKVRPRVQGGRVWIQFVVRAKGMPAVTCLVPVDIPAIGRPILDCNMTSSVEDDKRLDFDENTGDYEGEQSQSGRYTVFTITVNVQNIGEAQANDVKVVLIPLNGGAIIDEGIEPRQSTSPVDLQVNGIGRASWKLRPLRQAEDSLRCFEVRTSANNADLEICQYCLTIEGAPKLVELTLPKDAVGRYGDKIAVPVYATPTIGKDVNVYKLNVQYDPAVVRFISATNQGALTQFGWNGPQAMLMKSGAGATTPDVVRVSDFTTGSPLNSKTDGVLVYLLFEAVYGGEDATKLEYASSALRFIETLDYEGSTYVTSMNSTANDKHGDVNLSFVNGQVTVSGSCVVPLNSSLKFQLAQNTPNPFNPTTTIEYTVGFDTHVKLTVYDAMGRLVKTLVDEDQKAGEYRAVFNATELPSGTYIYKLETPRYTDMKRMILAR